ncbi:hypothetical protein JCM3766R1_001888 [Sporobolomyces carnicolor]
MVFKLLHRRSSQTSCSSSSSTESIESTSSQASFYAPLEPVEGSLPKELYAASRSTPPKRDAKCTLDVEREAWSNPFSFPRAHTHHHVCPKHGIRHDPFLALPGREERSFECGQYKIKPTKIAMRKTKTNKF